MSWYVLHLRPRSEKKVAEVCQAYGMEHYLPLREETKIYQRRKVTVRKPLFSGYLFAAVTPDTRIYLQRTNHIIRFLEPGSEENLLRDLAQIRLALEADPRLEADASLTEGGRVRIKGGPFMGIEGVLQSVRGKTQVRLNVEMIGQSVTLDVDRALLESIGG
jgi:transcriptional antiterminator RfaH